MINYQRSLSCDLVTGERALMCDAISMLLIIKILAKTTSHTYQCIKEGKACFHFQSLVLSLQLGAFRRSNHHFRRKGE